MACSKYQRHQLPDGNTRPQTRAGRYRTTDAGKLNDDEAWNQLYVAGSAAATQPADPVVAEKH